MRNLLAAVVVICLPLSAAAQSYCNPNSLLSRGSCESHTLLGRQTQRYDALPEPPPGWRQPLLNQRPAWTPPQPFGTAPTLGDPPPFGAEPAYGFDLKRR